MQHAEGKKRHDLLQRWKAVLVKFERKKEKQHSNILTDLSKQQHKHLSAGTSHMAEQQISPAGNYKENLVCSKTMITSGSALTAFL